MIAFTCYCESKDLSVDTEIRFADHCKTATGKKPYFLSWDEVDDCWETFSQLEDFDPTPVYPWGDTPPRGGFVGD